MPEFDEYARSYQELLSDPVRDTFASDSSFFAERKWRLLEQMMRQRGVAIQESRWLDVGCGQGDLLRYGRDAFKEVIGCDPSEEMIGHCADLKVVHQVQEHTLPFEAEQFDLVTKVCVYHHVEPAQRLRLMQEGMRVLRPGGCLCVIEHNPFNPMTQLIVSRTPVDQNAQLLSAGSTARLMRKAGLSSIATRYFLYLPQQHYHRFAWVEDSFAWLPLGGQYATWGSK